MIFYILLIALAAPAVGAALKFFVADNKREIRIGKITVELGKLIRIILSLALFVVLSVGRLYRENAIHDQVGLEGGLMPADMTLLAVIARWFAMLTTSMAILVPFFKKKSLHDYVAFVAPVSVVLSVVSLEGCFISISGSADPFHWENAMFFLEVFLTAVISVIELISAVLGDKSSPFGRLGGVALHIFSYFIAFMPPWAPGVLFGALGEEPKDFTIEHRLYMYFTLFVIFYVYLMNRKRSFDERYFALIALSMSAYFSYFSLDRTALSMLPLHLCNTAIILILVTYVFRLQGLFYFTYLVNVLGAVFAILMPNTYSLATEAEVILYWFDHIYAVALPILGVALGIFPRPNIKMVRKAIYVFTVYFVSIAFIDGWFNNASFNVNGEPIDYFFLYSTFYLDKVPAAAPLYQPWDIYIGEQLIRLYPAYQLTIYVIFIISMFALWGLYAALYRVSDDHKELARRRKLIEVAKTQLIKALDGRPLSDPINPEGRDMIKIEHFSKVYSGTDRRAVDDISIEVHAGEVFGFIGHNGAGKSTTIKSMVGIQSISEGKIEIEGYDISRQPLEAKMNIGYVSDNHAVYEKLTGREYVHYVADLYRVSAEDREARLAKYAKMFKLEGALDREIKGYSHGMKQKIMVISALIHNPKVWVLDEPLTGLDPTSSYQIKQCMREHADAGNIVFFSSHIIEVVERICDRIAIIADGKLQRCSTIEEIKASGKTLEQIYLEYIDLPDDFDEQKEEPSASVESSASPELVEGVMS